MVADISVLRYESMLPLEAAVTLAMNALCLAANSGLLSLDDLLALLLASLMSDRGDSEPWPAWAPGVDEVLTLRLRLLLLDSAATSIFFFTIFTQLTSLFQLKVDYLESTSKQAPNICVIVWFGEEE